MLFYVVEGKKIFLKLKKDCISSCVLKNIVYFCPLEKIYNFTI